MPVTYSSADRIADIPGATYDDLKLKFMQLAAVVDAVGNERDALKDEIRKREKEVALRARLGVEDKAILRAIVNSPTFSG